MKDMKSLKGYSIIAQAFSKYNKIEQFNIEESDENEDYINSILKVFNTKAQSDFRF
jgi:hypothetical protein